MSAWLGTGLGAERPGEGFPTELSGLLIPGTETQGVFIEFITILLLFHILLFFLAIRHVGAELPDQGSNIYPLHWKAKF